MKKLLFLAIFFFLIPQHSEAAAFYVDYSQACSGNGTATSTAFCSINAFTDVARSAGDIAIVRRGQSTTTGIVAASFTSDGTLNAPITVEADYDNLWGDFATTSETYTPTFGSTYMASSASSTKVATSTWIYLARDCYETLFSAATTTSSCQYAYEVRTASSTGIDLFLPYKGGQSGAGVVLRQMPAAPQIGTATETVQIFTMLSDDYWSFKGLDIRSTNSNIIAIGSSRDTLLYDMVFQTDGVTVNGMNSTAPDTTFLKLRYLGGSVFTSGSGVTGATVKDALLDCNNVASSRAIQSANSLNIWQISDMTIQNCTSDFSGVGLFKTILTARNLKRPNSINSLSGFNTTNYYFEDDFSIPGLNSQTSGQISSNTISTTTISTSTLRSGGGPTTELVNPPSGTGNTGLSTRYFPFSYIKLFEYPIYTNTSSKTYTMYFRSASSSSFTVNPLTATANGSSTPELYIECEYYGDTIDAARFLKMSNTASAVSFASDTNWYGISVTCQPSQSGILYLRGWYGKPRETPLNQFMMDNTPTII